MRMWRHWIVTFGMLGAMLASTTSDAAFYRYRGGDGRFVFVDDLSKVPEAYKNSVKVYPEAEDFMSEDERKALAAERERRVKAKRERYLQHIQRLETASESRRAPAQSQPLATPVTIRNNQVLVPVTVGFRGVETEVTMLLDTGANVTIVHDEVADALGLRWPKRTTMQVVGGRRLRAGIARVNHVTIGDIKLQNVEVGIISHQGGQLPYGGLLGMNVLRQVAFDIDIGNQMIIWRPRDGGEP
jgi:clan AA aspartic protease (TIGR02281 family)